MTRWFARLLDKRFLVFTVLTAAAIAMPLVAPRTFSKPPRATGPSLADIQLVQANTPDYSLQDGKIVSSNAPIDLDNPTAPGDVNVIDVDRANAIAAAQQKKAKGGGKGGSGRIYKTTVQPVWFDNNTRFWYRNDLKDGAKEFILVEVEKGTRLAAFDHDKLAAGLSKATGTAYKGNKLPFQTVKFENGLKAVSFTVNSSFWLCDLTTYEVKKTSTGPADEITPVPQPENDAVDFSHNSYDPEPFDELSPDEMAELEQQKGQKKGAGKGAGKGGPAASASAASQDGKWTAFTKNNNVWLRDKGGKETQMTQAGVDGDAFTLVSWAADSKVVVAYRTTPGEKKTVYKIETSPKSQLYPILHETTYPRAMDKVPNYEMWLIDVDNMKANKVDVDRIDHKGVPRLQWSKDNLYFTFEKLDRSRQRFRVIEVNARTGAVRNIIDEKSDSMVNHYLDVNDKNSTFYLKYLDATGEIIYLSEMDGWKHLYLIHAKSGKHTQMTKGEWVVRKILKQDDAKRQMTFLASGIYPDQDPYLLHYCRVNYDGTGFVVLTGGNGNHANGQNDPTGHVQFSPDGKYIIAKFERVDMAPAHDLRRVSDGKKICDLETSDTSDLEATGWKPPEVFVAKGRDGKTDIWGYVVRPRNYDPTKKYPVIENIYAGPHSSHVRKTFSETDALQTLAELGFIVVKIEGMGTMNRSRAFHAVSWQNIKDAGFPDRILWIKALAAKYSYVDITRVGIYGGSAGGQNAMGALLFHPEFYKVAVATCGCHDNRLDKSSWNEAWMGSYGPHYEASSNVVHAKNLQGRLLLLVGEMDTNVPPESTYRVVDALLKAGKDFDLIVTPGGGHGQDGAHGNRRRIEFFQKHLQGIDPPNHNAPGAAKGMVPKKGKGGDDQ